MQRARHKHSSLSAACPKARYRPHLGALPAPGHLTPHSAPAAPPCLPQAWHRPRRGRGAQCARRAPVHLHPVGSFLGGFPAACHVSSLVMALSVRSACPRAPSSPPPGKVATGRALAERVLTHGVATLQAGLHSSWTAHHKLTDLTSTTLMSITRHAAPQVLGDAAAAGAHGLLQRTRVRAVCTFTCCTLITISSFGK